MIELNLVLVSRRNMQVLQTVMQSQRASLLEKQEAELALMRCLAESEEKRMMRYIKLSIDLRQQEIAARQRGNATELRNLDLEEHINHLEELVSQNHGEGARSEGLHEGAGRQLLVAHRRLC